MVFLQTPTPQRRPHVCQLLRRGAVTSGETLGCPLVHLHLLGEVPLHLLAHYNDSCGQEPLLRRNYVAARLLQALRELFQLRGLVLPLEDGSEAAQHRRLVVALLDTPLGGDEVLHLAFQLTNPVLQLRERCQALVHGLSIIELALHRCKQDVVVQSRCILQQGVLLPEGGEHLHSRLLRRLGIRKHARLVAADVGQVLLRHGEEGVRSVLRLRDIRQGHLKLSELHDLAV
mmetsp:Transcript_2452/g.5288  ORF Transcript_2452/g.5288 Transcript_2452/m.5288 type:complete len:231 (-) Transcript_2452:754-1446(-)